MDRALKALTLIALGLYLSSRVVGGTLLFYINQRFTLYTILAGVGLVLVGASLYRRPDHNQDGAAEEAHHEHSPLSWLGLLILLVPLVLGLLVPPAPLGAAAAGNRQINVGRLSSISGPAAGQRMGLVPGERNILDWLAEIQAAGDPAAMDGQEARVIGFVYRDERFGADQFLVGRFIVNCCVADASPVGLVVEDPGANSLAADQWVEVTGRFAAGRFDGEGMPVLRAEQITPVEAPRQPYLYG
jgi:uncharacterized repeat protein (TIGR03943 family)